MGTEVRVERRHLGSQITHKPTEKTKNGGKTSEKCQIGEKLSRYQLDRISLRLGGKDSNGAKSEGLIKSRIKGRGTKRGGKGKDQTRCREERGGDALR